MIPNSLRRPTRRLSAVDGTIFYHARRVCKYLLASLLTCLPLAAPAESIDRVEPPFWWTGMAEEELQLMVHGRDIAGLEPSVTYPGVTLLGTETTGNDNYLFINLRLAPDTEPGRLEIALRDSGEARATIEYPLKARAPGSADRRGFDATDAIYLVTPDRFANGDTANDSTADTLEEADRDNPGGRHGGDIAGMRKHLDYIADMGFTQVWPNPLVENDQPAYSYHGYSATDFYRVDPRFGSNEDFREFVDAARKRGIGVIQDMVLNHIGNGHWWLRDLPAASWLNGDGTDKGEYTLTNHSRTTLVDPHASDSDRAAFVQGWFVDSMPDLNQRNPLLANYLVQNSIWWIEYAGLSGIRADTYAYSDGDFLQQWAARIHREYPDFNIVGEEWTRNPALVAHWQRGEGAQVSGGRLKSMMDFPLHYALREGLAEEDSWDSGLTTLYESLANDFLYPQPQQLVIFGGNHDTSRLFSQLNDDPALFRMAIAYLATMRGIPQFFYGDEVLMESPKERNDGIVRSDFPGGWAGDDSDAFTGKGLGGHQQQAQETVRKLFRWRRQAPVIHSGRLKHFSPRENTYVYFRYNDKDAVMVAINKGNEPYRLPQARFAEALGDSTGGVDVLTGERHALEQLEIPARDVLVLELD
ncbi:glycoside hydrolase family 13 protein [Microbulbifer halophilus]|uniref:glycoside hydrolase family 13 protein n=1 Tax=Microbulbifer halophilus TaxID=453963 RepID=UPI0036162979